MEVAWRKPEDKSCVHNRIMSCAELETIQLNFLIQLLFQLEFELSGPKSCNFLVNQRCNFLVIKSCNFWTEKLQFFGK